nr:hypothetical protein [Tanacetum cinerariifolium]
MLQLLVVVDKCKIFPLLGQFSTVSVFLGFGLTFAGTSKYWGVLRILMISPGLVPRFWSTTRIKTTEEGTKILATVDGKLRTVSESSIRRNLKLNNEEGIIADEPASPLRDDSQGQYAKKLDELTALCTSLQRQQSEMISRFEAQELKINSLKAIIKLLEDKDRRVTQHSRDDAPIKGKKLDEGEEAAKRVSDDIEEMATC